MSNKKIIYILVAISVIAMIVFNPDRLPNANRPLICHVGGTMTPVMKELARIYEEQTGKIVEINSAGSGELLAYISGQKKGDLYVCHDPFIDILMLKWRMGVDGWQLAELTPGIIVQKGNPKKIRTIKDLTRKDVRLILTDYKLSSLGRMMSTIFNKADIDFEQLNKDKKIITNKSGGYSANYVKMNNADAGMVWKAVWKLRDDALDFIPITRYLPVPYVDTVTSATDKQYFLTPMRVTVATLKCSRQPKAAKKFAEFVASSQAAETLNEYGFTMSGCKKLYRNGEVVEPDNLSLFVAAGMKHAVDEIVAGFKKESGITVDIDYGGSGIILSRVITAQDADLFMPGDAWYIEELQRKTKKVTTQKKVAYFIPTIIVPKGNPKNIKGLSDFTRADVKIGIGEAKSCQIGRLTKQIFDKNNINIELIKAKESTTVNELGVWVKLKNVDAAIVWDAIARNLGDAVETIEIPKKQNIISTVEIGLIKTTRDKDSSKKFIKYITSREGRRILNSNGYTTELD